MTASILPRPLALPDFPWDSLRPYRARAAQHPDGVVDLAVGAPVDPTPAVARDALAAASDAPGYPAAVGTHTLRAAIIDWMKRAGPGHAVRVELCSLAAHNPAQGLARGAEILLFQVPCNAQGAFLQTARRQADIDRKSRRAPAPRRAAIPFRQQNQGCRRPGRGQDDKRAGRHSGPEHAPTVGAASQQGLQAAGQGAHQADGVDAGGRFAQKPVQRQCGREQQRRGQRREIGRASCRERV